MEKVTGKTAFAGIAIGLLQELKKKEIAVQSRKIKDTGVELRRLEEALEIAGRQLRELHDKAVKEVGITDAAIFEVHEMMLTDDDYLDSIINIIETQKENAAYAVCVTGENFSQMFAAMDDEYMKARAVDIKDISARLIAVLCNTDGVEKELDEPVIIVADDLMPSETVQLDKEKVLAFVTRKGSVNSHTAILARTMNIPAIVNVDIAEDVDGKYAIVDGNAGVIYVEPDKMLLEKYEKLREEELQQRALLQELKGKSTVTRSGKEIKLYANIGGLGDMEEVLSNDAEGIGLFRSEFLYLNAKDYPTEEEQFQAYKKVAELMAGKKVIIRTLDIGADKQIDYFNMEKEENPALGYRAVRICLTREDIFKTQLRAILRASAYGNIAIMIPMITSLWEVEKVKHIWEEVKAQLRQTNISYGEVELGVMIETPAAVMISDVLAKEVDFFSIGTNDLTQYTLAIDRQNPRLDMFFDAHHPAVFRMIQIVIDNAHKEGIWAGICGELGADLNLTEIFLKMGIDELSMAPGCILPVRKRIREID